MLDCVVEHLEQSVSFSSTLDVDDHVRPLHLAIGGVRMHASYAGVE